MEQQIQHAEIVLSQQVTVEALCSLIMEILEDSPPIPVGEIGKMLQERTANPELSVVLKHEYVASHVSTTTTLRDTLACSFLRRIRRFGGLKKFIEGVPNLFTIGSDHPFNPHVSLVGAPNPSPVNKTPETRNRNDASGGGSASGSGSAGGGGNSGRGAGRSQTQQSLSARDQGPELSADQTWPLPGARGQRKHRSARDRNKKRQGPM